MTDTINEARKRVERYKDEVADAESAIRSAKYKEQEAYEDIDRAEADESESGINSAKYKEQESLEDIDRAEGQHTEALDKLAKAEKELAEVLEKGA